MEFRVLKYFLVVAQEGNFTRAAEKLHISQPTLSRQLQDLEEQYGKHDPAKYQELQLPARDCWGVLLCNDHPLATKKFISAKDLWPEPMIMSRQSISDFTHAKELINWLQKPLQELNIVGSYNLLFNASLMVDAGLGCALAFEDIINTHQSKLCFRPLEPAVYAQPNIFWKRNQFFSQASQKFLELLQKHFSH